MSDNKIGRNNPHANMPFAKSSVFAEKTVTNKSNTKKLGNQSPVDYSALSVGSQQTQFVKKSSSPASLDDIAEAVAEKLIQEGNKIPSGLKSSQQHNDLQKGIMQGLESRKADLPFKPRGLAA